MKFSLRESLLVTALFSILTAFMIQIHRQELSGDLSIPWQILVVFGFWLMIWLGGWLRTTRDEQGEPVRVILPQKALDQLAESCGAKVSTA